MKTKEKEQRASFDTKPTLCKFAVIAMSDGKIKERQINYIGKSRKNDYYLTQEQDIRDIDMDYIVMPHSKIVKHEDIGNVMTGSHLEDMCSFGIWFFPDDKEEAIGKIKAHIPSFFVQEQNRIDKIRDDVARNQRTMTAWINGSGLPKIGTTEFNNLASRYFGGNTK